MGQRCCPSSIGAVCCPEDDSGLGKNRVVYERTISEEEKKKYDAILLRHTKNFAGKNDAKFEDPEEFKVAQRQERNKWLIWRKHTVNTVDVKNLPRNPHEMDTWTEMLGTGFLREQLKTVLTVFANYQWQRKNKIDYEHDFHSTFLYVLGKRLTEFSHREGPTEVLEAEIDDIIKYLDETRNLLAEKSSNTIILKRIIFGDDRDQRLNGKLVSLWVRKWLSSTVKEYHFMAKAHVNAYLQMKLATRYLRAGIDDLLQVLYLAPMQDDHGLIWFDRHIYAADSFRMYEYYRETGLGKLMTTLLHSCEIDSSGLKTAESTETEESDMKSAKQGRERRYDPWEDFISKPSESGIHISFRDDPTFRSLIVSLHRLAQVLMKIEHLMSWLWGLSAEGGNFFIFFLKRDIVLLRDIHSESTRKIRGKLRELESYLMLEEQRQAQDRYSRQRTVFSRAEPYISKLRSGSSSFQKTHDCLGRIVSAAQSHDLADIYRRTMRGIGQFQQWTRAFCEELMTKWGYESLETSYAKLLPDAEVKKKEEATLQTLLALPPFPSRRPSEPDEMAGSLVRRNSW
eukprot:CAMPEP_0184493640 /NCGR_PEP_ID=MMETSP0113_2-20130426/26591_1 /TAXON_ID=91329 /ORGANISM="Norrisiella sphaerica, Strain BC52" /LENGTH=568 /DNA_ID=CAMNT_0026878979 /DNA_START=141 /DNA_END=1844 /DNA_ORIENTATION=-